MIRTSAPQHSSKQHAKAAFLSSWNHIAVQQPSMRRKARRKRCAATHHAGAWCLSSVCGVKQGCMQHQRGGEWDNDCLVVAHMQRRTHANTQHASKACYYQVNKSVQRQMHVHLLLRPHRAQKRAGIQQTHTLQAANHSSNLSAAHFFSSAVLLTGNRKGVLDTHMYLRDHTLSPPSITIAF